MIKKDRPSYIMDNGELLIIRINEDDDDLSIGYLSERCYDQAQRYKKENKDRYNTYMRAAKDYTASFIKYNEALKNQIKGNGM